ncbi:MAG: F0F1 ATP synthase subunit alpha, partial [Armatimonadota bacterium]
GTPPREQRAGLKCHGVPYSLNPDHVGVLLLGEYDHLEAGDEVRRTGRLLDVPVGADVLGRVIDFTGRPLDDRGPVRTEDRQPAERPAPPILHRAPVEVPLMTGWKVVDSLIPIGRGQRELIVGDRQTGKTTIALDTIINQRNKDVVCVYCSIGQRTSAVARVISTLEDARAMEYTTVMVARGEEPPGVQYVTAYAATTLAEYFRDRGDDALIVYDDFTRHARAYRELSLLLRRPPGREAFPGDIFYIHSRLLERATHLRDEYGGGSLTALPIIETEEENVSAYIPTNLISITDGQIYLSPDLYEKGLLPAVEVGTSVSRVGGKTQFPAYHGLAGELRLAYSQFEELEAFSRFGTRMEEETREKLERGRRVREILKQPEHEPMPVAEQIAVLVAVSENVFADFPIESVSRAEEMIREKVREELPDLCRRIAEGEPLTEEDKKAIVRVAEMVVE